MIQRIQSVLLGVALILNLAVLFVPLWRVSGMDNNGEATLYGMKISRTDSNSAQADSVSMTDEFPLLFHFILVVASSALLAVVVFQYKDREKQIKLAYVAAAILCLQVGLAIILTMGLNEFISVPANQSGNVMFGFFFPVVAIILTLIAARQIKKDDELVKSADRFR